MPSNTRSNKEQTLIFSDPALLERTIRKGKRNTSIDNNTCSSNDIRLPSSTETTLPSTAHTHPTSIEIPPWTSIDTEPRDRFMDDLEESSDFGVFWSLLSAELQRRIRCLAMRGYAHFIEEWSVCLARGNCRGNEGLSIDGEPLPSIDGAPLPSIDGDARIWAKHIL
ncbi:hypothetical protein F2Q69_00035457 [Brassica cretica]|uniref:Uncharacterized protein n=1 Tax=Brassica cretica TaxID=69181 RepID=A0A8S9SUW9_BRACR|nr:hypothetical protein F2Q69_00035457 [Brassica cretica]